MICCLNPDCYNPCSPEDTRFCPNCGIGLVILRNRYRPIRSIGGGGFAKTYLAFDIDKLNEPCVIKQFAPLMQGTGPLHKAKELFEQEARRLQQLGGHPQIPTLFAYFEQDYRLYLVQQYIDGQNLLAELQQQGTFSEQKIWELLLDLLNILKSVHQQQVIHRDIKPHNILRRSSPPTTPLIQEGTGGDLVLIDFGASKQLTATVMSQPGTTIGSFGYVPIEQMQDGQAYPASDLYSLGATCFHLLTGISPWELWKRQGYGWVADWRQHLQQPVSQELGRIIDKLLQEDYHQRYHSAPEVLQDLIPATSPKPPIPIPQPPASPPPKVPLSVQSSPQALPTPSAASLKQNVLLKKLLLMGGAILLVVFGGYKVLHTTIDLPVKTVAYENLALANTLTEHNAPVYALAISPEGQTLVSSSDKTIKIWHLLTGKPPSTLIGHEDVVNALAISPDGQTLVSGSTDKTIKIWHLWTGKLQSTLNEHTDRVNALAISPDGQTLVSGSRDQTIKIWNLKTGELKNTLTKHTNSVTSLAFNPDGQTLASADRNGTINIWNFNTGVLKPSPSKQEKEVWVVLISPDGQTLISGSGDTKIKIWDLQTGHLKNTLTGHTGWVGSLIISPDGQTLISGSGDKTIKIWDRQTGNLKKTLTGHKKGVVSLAISPDGKTLVSGSEDNTIKIWRIL